MSEYRHYYEEGWHKVKEANGPVICRAWSQADAERIARALQMLDAHEALNACTCEADNSRSWPMPRA